MAKVDNHVKFLLVIFYKCLRKFGYKVEEGNKNKNVVTLPQRKYQRHNLEEN